jgi:hypothetical protein
VEGPFAPPANRFLFSRRVRGLILLVYKRKLDKIPDRIDDGLTRINGFYYWFFRIWMLVSLDIGFRMFSG